MSSIKNVTIKNPDNIDDECAYISVTDSTYLSLNTIDVVGDIYIRFYIKSSESNTITLQCGENIAKIDCTTSWQEVNVYFSSTSSFTPEFAFNTANYWIYNMKLEHSNRPSAYSRAPEDDVQESNENTLELLKSYSTTEEVKSAIEQMKDSITLSVSSIYATTETVNNAVNMLQSETIDRLKAYSTTKEMNSAIEMTANSITQSVSESYVATSTYDGDKQIVDSRLDSAEQKITPTAIVSTVTSSTEYKDDLNEKTDSSEIISTINQSAEEIQIEASKINLKGAITMESFSDSVVETLNDTVTSVDVYYALSSSSTTAPTNGWSTIAPTWQDGKYMWQKTTTTYSDGTTEDSNATCITGASGKDGKDGTNGTNGKDGTDGTSITIKSTSVTYQDSSSGTSVPTGAWQSSIPTVAKGQYLWTKTIVTYSDSTTTTAYSIAYQGTNGEDGDDGDDGASVTAISQEYYVSNSSTSLSGGSWSTSYSWTSGKYVWTRISTTLSDGTTKTSTGAYNSGITTSLQNSLNASDSATNALNRVTYSYGTCSTAASTAAKVVTLDGFSLYTGATVSVSFTYANSVANATLNVNSTGAKTIQVYGSALTADSIYNWAANAMIDFTYDGTYWKMSTTSADSVVDNWCATANKTYIDGGKIYTGTITSDQIKSNTITANEIASNAITTEKLAANAVTAAKINTSDLFAQTITATGTITGGEFKSGYISGSVTKSFGTFAVTDLITVKQIILGLKSSTTDYINQYDINGNGVIDQDDLDLIKQSLLTTSSTDVGNITTKTSYYIDISNAQRPVRVNSTYVVGGVSSSSNTYIAGGSIYTRQANISTLIPTKVLLANGQRVYTYDTDGNTVRLCGMSTSNNYWFGNPYTTDDDLTGHTYNVLIGSCPTDSGVSGSSASTCGCADQIQLRAYSSVIFNLQGGSVVKPSHDAYTALGGSSYRWTNIYGVTGSINTSDKNYKKNIKDIDDKYLDLLLELRPKSYQMIDGNRTHIGFISQDVEELLPKYNLTDLDFAGFCKDVKQETKIVKEQIKNENGEIIQDEETESVDVLDENGNPEYIYSLRYTEFIALNTALIQRQQKQINELTETVNSLIERLERLENK
jgi:hypothetical protein